MRKSRPRSGIRMYVRDDEFPDEGATRYSERYGAGTKLCDLGSVGGGELDTVVVF